MKDDNDVTSIKLECLAALASQQISANGRNYYLTEYQESVLTNNKLVLKPSEDQKNRTNLQFAFFFISLVLFRQLFVCLLFVRSDAILTAPLDLLFKMMGVNLNGEKASTTDSLVCFHFTDVNQKVSVHVRRGIADIKVCVSALFFLLSKSPSFILFFYFF
jgi:alkyl sulfatase BDS1-like metallo-beta-lactamase superfamily hydrolase